MNLQNNSIQRVDARCIATIAGLALAVIGCRAGDNALETVSFHDAAGDYRVASTASLTRSPDVNEAKIARKSRSAGKSKPKNPSGLQLERYRNRLDANGQLPANALMKAKQVADRLPELVVQGNGLRDAGIWNWEWLGPGNIGGRIRAIAIDPSQPARMWIGGVAGGIWRTTNGGASWSPANDFLASLSVTSLVLDPSDPDVLYAGTGEGFGNIDALPGAGVFNSKDGGATWSQLRATIPQNADPTNDDWGFVNRLAMSPDSGLDLLAATNSGIWRTSDGGESWRQETMTRTLDVDFHPTDGQRAVASGDNGTIQYSNDGGASWSRALLTGTPGSTTVRIAFAPDANTADDTLEVNSTAGLAAGDSIRVGSGGGQETRDVVAVVDADTLTVKDLGFAHGVGDAVNSQPGGRVELAYAASNPSIVYASMDVGGGTIWRSTNGGANFSLISNTNDNYLGGQGWYDNTIWVAPDDSNFVVVGGIDLWRSTDGGANLTKISDWTGYHTGTSAHADHHIIVTHPGYDGNGNRTVFVGNDGGIQRADDIARVGQNSGWVNLANNLGITQFYGGAAAPDGSVIVGGAQDNDKLRYKAGDGTGGWYQAMTGDGGYAAVDFDSPSTIYGEFVRLTIYKSVNSGNSYTTATTGLGDAGTTNARFIAPFCMDPSDPAVLVGGGASIWRTTDSAAQWGSIRGPIAGMSPPLCSAIDVAKTSSTRIWVGYENGRVSRTTNAVSSWTDVDNNGSNPLPNTTVTDIAINPTNASEVIVTFGGYTGNGVWFTSDSGANWMPRNGTAPHELPPVQVNTVRYHPANPNWVYIGTDIGVFASEDKGLTWSRTPRYAGVGHEGPVNTEVSELFWQGDEHLIAATHGRGMYRVRTLPVVYVDLANAGFEDGSQEDPYDTVQEALNASGHGTAIRIEAGEYDEGSTTFFKRGVISATNGSVVIH